MSIMVCNCGCFIDLDDNPEAFYFERPDGREVELDRPLCDGCKEEKLMMIENAMKDRL